MSNDCIACQEDLKKVANAVGVNISNRMKALSEKYGAAAEDLKEKHENEAWADFDIGWDETRITFDLPEVTMVRQDWSLDLPQVTMTNQEMIFHTPSSRMGTQKVGQYPEFHGFEIVWKDILTDVPEFFIQEQRIVVGVPEFRMDTTAISLDVPEFAMKTQTFIMGLPQFTLKAFKVDIQLEADVLKASATSEVTAVKQEAAKESIADFSKAANTMFSCFRTSLQNKRLETAALMEPAIIMLQSSISKFESIDSDESRAMVSELNGKLRVAQEKKAEIDIKFATQIAMLLEQEQAIVSDFAAKLTA